MAGLHELFRRPSTFEHPCPIPSSVHSTHYFSKSNTIRDTTAWHCIALVHLWISGSCCCDSCWRYQGNNHARHVLVDNATDIGSFHLLFLMQLPIEVWAVCISISGYGMLRRHRLSRRQSTPSCSYCGMRYDSGCAVSASGHKVAWRPGA